MFAALAALCPQGKKEILREMKLIWVQASTVTTILSFLNNQHNFVL
jgi:hypothetical protein